MSATDVSGNLLLAGLPPRDLAILTPHLESVTLRVRHTLSDPDQPIEFVYFPENGMVSILGVLTDATGVETASVGREGMVGMPIFHRTDRMPEQAVVQLPGRALRMTAQALRDCLPECPALEEALHHFSVCLYVFAAQSNVCMCKHSVPRRLARWLLHASDQSGTESLQLSHLYIAQMLGVRRSSVTVAAGALRKKKLITYSRNHVLIVDRAGLEAAACECYRVIRSTYDRLVLGAITESPNAQVESSRDGMSVITAPIPERARTGTTGD